MLQWPCYFLQVYHCTTNRYYDRMQNSSTVLSLQEYNSLGFLQALSLIYNWCSNTIESTSIQPPWSFPIDSYSTQVCTTLICIKSFNYDTKFTFHKSYSVEYRTSTELHYFNVKSTVRLTRNKVLYSSPKLLSQSCSRRSVMWLANK